VSAEALIHHIRRRGPLIDTGGIGGEAAKVAIDGDDWRERCAFGVRGA